MFNDDDYLKLDIFKTLLNYDPDVSKAIEDTKMVLADLFPLDIEEGEEAETTTIRWVPDTF